MCAYQISSLTNLKYGSSAGNRTFTVIGTPHYMAPEIMESKGYSFPADVWSLGVTMYEICFGFLPYAGDIDDPIEIYQ